MSRLNALLLVTKSCEGRACQDPRSQLDIDFPESDRESSAEPAIDTLRRALEPGYDKYFDSLPKVHFGECLKLQMIENESPFYPPGAEDGLGFKWRKRMDHFDTHNPNRETKIPRNEEPAGTEKQCHGTLEQVMADSRELTDAELGLEEERRGEGRGRSSMF